jgi:predicted HTH transcriptional regulator
LDETRSKCFAASEKVSSDEVLKLLDFAVYFDLLDKTLPNGRDGILDALASDRLIESMGAGYWRIFNLGAILFAKKLSDFGSLQRKAVRVIVYQGTGRITTLREQKVHAVMQLALKA